MTWLLGFIAIIGYRLFNAGMKTDSLFYVDRTGWDTSYKNKVKVRQFDGELAFGYVAVTIVVALTWPLSLPAIGIYLLGKKLAK
jgi:hypothetical protein